MWNVFRFADLVSWMQVSTVLSGMVAKLLEHSSVRLLKHIVRCYLRMSEHPRAREALRLCLPEALTDQSFGDVIRSEEAVQRWLAHLLKNLSDKSGTSTTSGPAGGAQVKPHDGYPSMPYAQQQQQQQQRGIANNPLHTQGSTWKPPNSS
jgi:hypothetical protein